MKAAESEGPDAHFAVDKQSISLRPRGKSSLCSGSASRSVLLSAAPTNAASPAEPPPDTGPCPVPRKPLVVQAAAVVLLLGLSASVLLQAALCAVTGSPVSSEMSCCSLPPGCGDTLIGISTCMFVLKEMLFCAQETFTHFFISRVRPTPAVPLLFGALWAAADNDILQMVSQGWKYFRGNFYYFSQVSKTWYSAQQFCMSRDSQLTSVTSESEQEFLYRTAGGLSYWIGLTKAGSEGDWSWVDDTPFDKVQSAQFWIPGEPNNEHCADIKVSSLQSWNDVSCDSTLFFICKRPYSPSEP